MKKKKKNKKDFTLEIFNECLKHEKELKDMMGYCADEIRQIGVHKFIKAMGWDSKEQVTSWKTDKAHMKPCDECGEEFGCIELSYGLCPNCEKKFDTRKMQETLELAMMADPSGEQYSLLICLILTNSKFRHDFYTKGIDNGFPIFKTDEEEGEIVVTIESTKETKS